MERQRKHEGRGLFVLGAFNSSIDRCSRQNSNVHTTFNLWKLIQSVQSDFPQTQQRNQHQQEKKKVHCLQRGHQEKDPWYNRWASEEAKKGSNLTKIVILPSDGGQI